MSKCIILHPVTYYFPFRCLRNPNERVLKSLRLSVPIKNSRTIKDISVTFDGKEFIKTCHLFPVLATMEKQQRTLHVIGFCAHFGCGLSEQKLFRRDIVQRTETHFMLSTLFL
jgi:hypothetical protein